MRSRLRKFQRARTRVAGSQASVATPAADKAPAPQGAPKRKCVLVVEDNATVGGLLVGLVREDGYRVLRAWDARDAVKMARDRRPDLIVLDLSLPYPEGLPILAELSASEETMRVPIVAVASAAAVVPVEQRSLLQGIVVRPYDVDRLLNIFRQQMGDPEQEVPERAYASSDTHLNSW